MNPIAWWRARGVRLAEEARTRKAVTEMIAMTRTYEQADDSGLFKHFADCAEFLLQELGPDDALRFLSAASIGASVGTDSLRSALVLSNAVLTDITDRLDHAGRR